VASRRIGPAITNMLRSLFGGVPTKESKEAGDFDGGSVEVQTNPAQTSSDGHVAPADNEPTAPASLTMAAASSRAESPRTHTQSAEDPVISRIDVEEPRADDDAQSDTSLGRKRMSRVTMTVNGREISGDVEDRTLLVDFLRQDLNLTGTHVGCDTSQCGACVVHVDGKAVKACTLLAVQTAGSHVRTIEGLASGGALHPVQEAFREHHGLQCGFCTPGMIMAAVDMIERHGGNLDETTVRSELEGNICRCTGYHNIVKAILDAASKMGDAAKQAAE